MTNERTTDNKGSFLSAQNVAGIVILVIVVVFVVENTARTQIRFLGPKVDAPLWVALLGAALLGAFGGALLRHHRHR